MTGNTCSTGAGTTGAGNCIAAIACGPANRTIADTNNPKRRIVFFAIAFPCARQPATKFAKLEYFKSTGYRAYCLSTGSEKGNGP